MELKHSIRFFVVEKITFIYIFLTSLIIIYYLPNLSNGYNLLAYRFLFVVIIVFLACLNSVKNIWPIRLIRYAFLGSLLAYWYPETFDINRVIVNCDYILAGWDQSIFGFQPALVFSKLYPQFWFSEILHMGYFSFYPLIVGVSLYFFFTNRKYFEFFFFTVLFSFFCYYIIYILFPTAGPQYYYPAIGMNNVESGFFPQIGLYFNEKQTLLSDTNKTGFFFHLVENTQQVGERPTAAFPSSHVGISTLIMILIFKKHRRTLFLFVLPFYLALVTATVYIRAHYIIDVAAGLVTAYLFYLLSVKLYGLLTRKYFGVLELSPHFHVTTHKQHKE
jgi:membrane-associated phospholipid phosphatase